MFTPPRYIALDDDLDELRALVDALHAIGAPCVGVHYAPPDIPLPDPAFFAGFRILLTDLYILKGTHTPQIQYNALASLLDSCVPSDHGPYLVVLWTSRDEERAAFAQRLDEVLTPAKRPIAVLALEKNRFRRDRGWDGPALQTAVRERLAELPQLAALLSWERDVLAAANTTLALVGGLVPAADRGAGGYATALDRVLSLLGRAAYGDQNATADPRGAVSAALAPLLADRVLNQAAAQGADELWRGAVTFAQGLAPLTDIEKGRMHRMLHVAVPTGEPVARTDWGAVIPLDASQLEDASMLARFGATASDLRQREFKLKADRLGEGQLVVIRGGAACDQAQGNAGPLPLLLGLLVPTGARSKDKVSPAVHACPEQLLMTDADAESHSLLVHARFGTSVVRGDLEQWSAPILRIREQLLMTILFHAANHSMRPGTLKF